MRVRGHLYEDFTVGQVLQHHWGRTLNETDNTLFSTLTLHFNPTYFNAPYAQELGYKRVPLNPLLVFNTVVGMSVEDLSEIGGPFLGIDQLVYHQPVYPGETVYARSTVVAKRESASNPENGIVSWRTEGFNQGGEPVLSYDRTNLVRKGAPAK
ncbi:dehydratase [Cupriavidus necator]|uniref:Dehydratase n=1 Tax=Cupriavidus necator TaxID=106590 RepID=A0A1U9UN70_CUPNE|nr:dehydratase [Cupriavidus necator]